jgi:hypothetical protein
MVWLTLGRIVVVPLAFGTAALVALFVMLTLGYERFVQALSRTSEAEGIEAIFGVLGNGMVLASALTALPAFALVVIGEVARIRSALFYVIGGGLALALIPILTRVATVAPSVATSAIWQVFATAGFAGGFVYWVLAGRKA